MNTKTGQIEIKYWGVHVCGGEKGRVLKKSTITVHLSLGKTLRTQLENFMMASPA